MTAPTDSVIFDKKDQLDRVQELLLPGEQLFMVLDAKGRGSGFLGITDKRLILRDDGALSLKKQILSIPYSKLHAVGVESDQGWRGKVSRLGFKAGDDDWDLEFRGDKAHDAYRIVMQHVLG